ncbi:hypothetical protein HPC49_52830 [Pyxidicoccus fallax]|uniref:Uncharacterized protein n=1 Tax=Pyxidicoccus fallax TaxID=394095 RepID=A0A848LYX5_9BACT|nr:hypothetical protein [Pyxidicoccus fallax]NMO22839.1 hypothetical protein [Pyxidicoccus fallax]NPC86858.1 hypothetical protein [Pyxidicoccus fallax]
MRALLFLTLTLSAGSAAAAPPSGCQEDYSTCKEDCAIEYGGSSRYLKKLTACFADCQESLDNCADRHSTLKGLPPGAIEEARPTRRKKEEETARKKSKKDIREDDPWADESPATPRKKRDPNDPFGYDAPADSKGGTEKRDAYRASGSRETAKEEIPPAPDSKPGTGARATSSRAHAEETVSGDGARRTGYRASEGTSGPEVSLGLEDEEPREGRAEPAPEPVAKPAPKSAPAKPAAETVKPAPVKEEPAVAAGREEKDPLLDDAEPTVLPAPPPTRKPETAKPQAPPRSKPPEPKKDISEWDPNGD